MHFIKPGFVSRYYVPCARTVMFSLRHISSILLMSVTSNNNLWINIHSSEIILGGRSANERGHYHVTPFLLGQAHTQNDHCNSPLIIGLEHSPMIVSPALSFLEFCSSAWRTRMRWCVAMGIERISSIVRYLDALARLREDMEPPRVPVASLVAMMGTSAMMGILERFSTRLQKKCVGTRATVVRFDWLRVEPSLYKLALSVGIWLQFLHSK